MREDADIKKVARQHLEMDDFFTGFSLKKDNLQQQQVSMENNKQAEAVLEQIGDEIRQCRRCELGTLRTNAVPGAGNPDAQSKFLGARRNQGQAGRTLHRDGI